MTTRLFTLVDQMAAALQAVPALAGRIAVESTLPTAIAQLPAVNVVPRSFGAAGVAGEVQGRAGGVLLVIRAGGERSGRQAHELLAQAHAALMGSPLLQQACQLDLTSETFRYQDADLTVCDLQAEYTLVYEHTRGDLSSL